jgi:hypothetical protein
MWLPGENHPRVLQLLVKIIQLDTKVHFVLRFLKSRPVKWLEFRKRLKNGPFLCCRWDLRPIIVFLSVNIIGRNLTQNCVPLKKFLSATETVFSRSWELHAYGLCQSLRSGHDIYFKINHFINWLIIKKTKQIARNLTFLSFLYRHATALACRRSSAKSEIFLDTILKPFQKVAP